MIYNYKGPGGINSKCGLEVHKNLVIVTEIPAGISVSGWAEELARLLCEKFKIDLKELIYVEHTPENIYPLGNVEEFCLVQFNLDSKKGTFSKPRWTQITPEVVDALRKPMNP